VIWWIYLLATPIGIVLSYFIPFYFAGMSLWEAINLGTFPNATPPIGIALTLTIAIEFLF
jgi:hypothetical protein